MKTLRTCAALKPAILSVLMISAAWISTGAQAQTNDESSYAIQEDRGAMAQADRPNADEGPVRLARFSYIRGNVTWRADDGEEWSTASINLPLREGAQIWVTDGGRAEIQFDDGSFLRLGNNSVATLQTLYSDGDGEFTELRLTDGLATLRLKHDHSVFQVDTPLISIKATGPARLRIGAGDGAEVGVRSGAATVEGAQGTVAMRTGDYLDLSDSDSSYDLRRLPRGDSWEQWNDERDAELAAAENDNRTHNVPSNISLVNTDLSSYGDWREEPDYGWVWCPRSTSADWRPYYQGHWTWVNPFGWTWVSDEPWGWAPYHYGTWTHLSRGWAWVPGPAAQCWSPAVVHFTEYENRVAWCPLAPAEVRYAPLASIGLRGRNWSVYFSIGHAAVYYPVSAGYCEPRAFNSSFVNHYGGRNGGGNRNAPSALGRFQNSTEFFTANSNTYSRNQFVPQNSRRGFGVTAANTADFGGRARYEPIGQSAERFFQSGRGVGAPRAGLSPVAGPIAARPSRESLTPSRTYLSGARLPSDVSKRQVFRAPNNPATVRDGQRRDTFPGSAQPPNAGIERRREPSRQPAPGYQDGRSPSGPDVSAPGGRTNPIQNPGSRPAREWDRTGTTGRARAQDARSSLGVGGQSNQTGGAPRGGGGNGSDGGNGNSDARNGASRQRTYDPARGTPSGTDQGVGSDRRREPRRDPAPQPPVRVPETRRDPAPQLPTRVPEPRREKEKEKPKDAPPNPAPGGSSSPVTGRGRR